MSIIYLTVALTNQTILQQRDITVTKSKLAVPNKSYDRSAPNGTSCSLTELPAVTNDRAPANLLQVAVLPAGNYFYRAGPKGLEVFLAPLAGGRRGRGKGQPIITIPIPCAPDSQEAAYAMTATQQQTVPATVRALRGAVS